MDKLNTFNSSALTQQSAFTLSRQVWKKVTATAAIAMSALTGFVLFTANDQQQKELVGGTSLIRKSPSLSSKLEGVGEIAGTAVDILEGDVMGTIKSGDTALGNGASSGSSTVQKIWTNIDPEGVVTARSFGR